MAHTLTTCTFCGVDCGTRPEATGDKVTGTYFNTPHPPNCKRIYTRRWHVHEMTSAADRMTQLTIEEDSSFQSMSRNEAYDTLKNAARYLTNILVLCSNNVQCLVQTLLPINVEVKDGSRSKRELFLV
jgi:predicted molibdopterin-dependent oxidoreductase YjgC